MRFFPGSCRGRSLAPEATGSRFLQLRIMGYFTNSPLTNHLPFPCACTPADLLTAIRTQVLIQLIKPYTRIRIPFISQGNHRWLGLVARFFGRTVRDFGLGISWARGPFVQHRMKMSSRAGFFFLVTNHLPLM